MTYVYQPTNPLASFAEGFQAVDALRQRQTQMQQQQAQQVRAQQMQQALANLRTNPSPQAIADFQLQFPEMKEGVDGYFKTLDAAQKATEDEASQKALFALRSGGNVAAVFEEYAAAAQNGNNPALAKKFMDAAEFSKQSPEAAGDVVRLRLAFSNPELYDKIYKSTAAIDNYEYFKGILGDKKVEEIIGITPKDGIQVLPNGMVIAGPDSPLAKSFGGGAGGAASDIPTVTTKQQVEALAPGATFIWGPTGRQMTKQGGAASNGSGNFR